MAIEITCIGCGKVLHVPDVAAGKKGKCTHCGAILQVPAVEEQPFTEAAPEFLPPNNPPPRTNKPPMESSSTSRRWPMSARVTIGILVVGLIVTMATFILIDKSPSKNVISPPENDKSPSESKSMGSSATSAVKSFPLSGEEVSVLQIKADRNAYYDKNVVICGGIGIKDYYNYGYRDAQESHYSLDFSEYNKNARHVPGGHIDAYVLREIGKPLIDKVIAAQKEGFGEKAVRVRAVLKSSRHQYESYGTMLEIVDWQFLNSKGDGWQPWALGGN
jgi:hypothetical protein